MDNFKIIYRILRILEKAMDLTEFDKSELSASALGISEPRWNRIMTMLAENKYVSGIDVRRTFSTEYPQATLVRPEITLLGLEYLEENTFMKKAAGIAKGIKETIPGL